METYETYFEKIRLNEGVHNTRKRFMAGFVPAVRNARDGDFEEY